MKLGSHFDGIAGFPLAATINGIEPVWATEIEPLPIKVSKTHFPNMKHYGSITDISGADLEPVDIITFGSPCQDLSVAGKRAGLGGERSGLFMEAVRTIREMRDATNGVYPRFAVWENVPGALSSAGGADFRAVLEELCETEIPIPRSGKWSNAGMVRGIGREIAWRIIDAQYWGVPQRRRRIFLVADFAGQRAAEILFEQPCLPGHFKESGSTGQDAPGSAGSGVKAASRVNCLTPWDGQGNQVYDAVTPNTAWACLRGTKGQGHPGTYAMVKAPQLYDMTHAEEVMRPVKLGLAPTLNSRMGIGGNQVPVMLEATFSFSAGQSDKARTIGFQKEVTPTLRGAASGTNMTPTILAFGHKDFGGDAGIVSPTLRAMNNINSSPAGGGNVAVAYDPKDLGRRPATFENVSPALKARCGTGGNNVPVTEIGYAVRRLTPGECEKLQGFPPGWTDIPGASDTGRYKALGNSVAIPCVEWIMRRIAQEANR